ncbi:MAG: gamma-glutamyltransferase [Phycisphaerales bacterium]
MMKFSPLTAFVILILAGALGGCEAPSRITDSEPDSGRVFSRGVVAADHRIASEAGLEMLKLGGNAIDAAVATSFTLAVTRPFSCGIGGGGFMVIHLVADDDVPSRSAALVYRERAPSMVGPMYYANLGVDEASRYGRHASGVPGTVAGLLHALASYGRLDRTVVLAPAIRAAEEGFLTDDAYVAAATTVVERFAERPELIESIGRERYEWFCGRFLMDGSPRAGEIIRQPELAATLRLIAQNGAAAFYVGPIAEAIEEATDTLTTEDLARYEVEERRPLEGEILGRRVLVMPPPSSGGIAMLQIFGILERHQIALNSARWNGPSYAHLVIEAMKHAFADRAEWLADDAFAPVPIDKLLDPVYLDELAARIDADRTFNLDHYGSRAPAGDDHGTSHLSVIDAEGNAVACTETINLEFGSLNVVPEYGIILNNEMDDFLTIPGQPNAFGLTQSDRNLPAPGKRPLSSMSPTIVIGADGRVELVAGASGGPRIITGTLQVVLNLLLFVDDPQAAVAAPRFHHQWAPNAVYLEDRWVDDETRSYLEDRGHEIRRRDGVGVVQVITRRGDGYSAASDPRKGGEPAGW